MASCLVCGVEVRIGTLCRAHAAALSTCDSITAEQIVSAPPDQTAGWLIDQWGCTHPLAATAVIGRSASDCNPGVLHPSVSVVHAELRAAADGWQLVDRGSLNGTFVNDERVRTAGLASGDRLRFGEVSFFFSAGSLPSVQESGTTGRTVPSQRDEIALDVALTAGDRQLRLVQRPGGGVLRHGPGSQVDLASLEFALLAALVRASAGQTDRELAFVSSAALAEQLEFNSRQADSDNVRELVRRVRKKLRAAGFGDPIDSRQRVGYRLAWAVDSPSR